MNWVKQQLKKLKTWLVVVFFGATAYASVGAIQPTTYSPTCDKSTFLSMETAIKDLRVNKGFLDYRKLNSKERANLKGCEISKHDFRGKYTKNGVDVKIVKIEKIKGGVQIFARAWKNGKQLGFGKDGSVDIERFRIFNPPVLVDDPKGTITRDIFDIDGKKIGVRTLREDPAEAMRQVISHNAKLVGKEGTKIVKGKIGNTTSTFYPDADPESTSVDGYAGGEWSSSWDTTHDQTTSLYVDDSSTVMYIRSRWIDALIKYDIRRAIILFDASALPDDDTLDSATLSTYVTTTEDTDNDAQAYISVVSSTPASNTAVVKEDFDQVGAVDNPTEGVDSGQRKDITGISTSAYLDFTLNSTGLGWISKTSISKFGMREGHDIEDVAVLTNDGSTHIGVSSADETGTTQDPKLVVVHSGATTEEVKVPDLIIFE